jgi:hypothetical protein
MPKTSTAPRSARVLGALTAGYGAYTLARPQSLLRASGLEQKGAPSSSGLALARLIGARDVLSGLAMVTAPAGPLLRAAIWARVASDGSDVVGFGSTVPETHRTKVLAVASGWGLLCAATLRKAGGR